jgi:hypothetical protein
MESGYTVRQVGAKPDLFVTVWVENETPGTASAPMTEDELRQVLRKTNRSEFMIDGLIANARKEYHP